MSHPRFLAFAAFVIAAMTQPTAADQIGPSFDCAAARQPLAQILCADPDLSQTDLRFAQAYFALLPQLDDAGKRDLSKRIFVSWMRSNNIVEFLPLEPANDEGDRER